MIGQHYLDDALRQVKKLRKQADAAVAQVDDHQMFEVLGPESNSIAIIMKHMAGNMRSRWTDFLTSDGEKPDRDRDREFERSSDDTADAIRGRWEDGWDTLVHALSSLTADDLQKTVCVRGEAHTVLEAINRQTTHYAGHVGQIVLLARHLAGARWQTLSIPRGKSKEFEARRAKAGDYSAI